MLFCPHFVDKVIRVASLDEDLDIPLELVAILSVVPNIPVVLTKLLRSSLIHKHPDQ